MLLQATLTCPIWEEFQHPFLVKREKCVYVCLEEVQQDVCQFHPYVHHIMLYVELIFHFLPKSVFMQFSEVFYVIVYGASRLSQVK